jgi:hypothetical protein
LIRYRGPCRLMLESAGTCAYRSTSKRQHDTTYVKDLHTYDVNLVYVTLYHDSKWVYVTLYDESNVVYIAPI